MSGSLMEALLDAGPWGIICAVLIVGIMALWTVFWWSVRRAYSFLMEQQEAARIERNNLLALIQSQIDRTTRDQTAMMDSLRASTTILQAISETTKVMHTQLANHRDEVRNSISALPATLTQIAGALQAQSQALQTLLNDIRFRDHGN